MERPKMKPFKRQFGSRIKQAAKEKQIFQGPKPLKITGRCRVFFLLSKKLSTSGQCTFTTYISCHSKKLCGPAQINPGLGIAVGGPEFSNRLQITWWIKPAPLAYEDLGRFLPLSPSLSCLPLSKDPLNPSPKS